MRILAIDAAGQKCSAAVIENHRVLAQHVMSIEHGQPSGLPGLIRTALALSVSEPHELGLVAVVVGPGSFTGIRSSLALAHGISASLGIRLVGVTVAEVASASLPGLPDTEMWCAVAGRGEKIILEWGGKVGVFQPKALPDPTGPTTVTGNAGAEVASHLAERGHSVAFVSEHAITMLDVAIAAEKRASDREVSHEVKPLYAERPAALLPVGGLRSAPAP